LARARWPLLAAGWALAFFLVWQPQDRLLLNRGDRPTRLWESVAPRGGRCLPSLVSRDRRDAWLAAFWTAGLGVLLVLDARRRR
jgi:hypothetical protein